MTEKTTGTSDQAQEIQNQLNQTLIELDQIRNTQQVITDPNAMEAVERTIVQAADKIAALMTALKIQQAIEFGWRMYTIYLYLNLLNYEYNYIWVQEALEAGAIGQSFWIDCGKYHMMVGLQNMIERACPGYF